MDESYLQHDEVASFSSVFVINHQNVNDLEIIIINKELVKTPDMKSLLLTHEIFWQHTILTFEPLA